MVIITSKIKSYKIALKITKWILKKCNKIKLLFYIVKKVIPLHEVRDKMPSVCICGPGDI